MSQAVAVISAAGCTTKPRRARRRGRRFIRRHPTRQIHLNPAVRDAVTALGRAVACRPDIRRRERLATRYRSGHTQEATRSSSAWRRPTPGAGDRATHCSECEEEDAFCEASPPSRPRAISRSDHQHQRASQSPGPRGSRLRRALRSQRYSREAGLDFRHSNGASPDSIGETIGSGGLVLRLSTTTLGDTPG